MMQIQSTMQDRQAGMNAARRRLARLKLASVSASVVAMGGLTTAISMQASAHSGPAQSSIATTQSTATATAAPSPTATTSAAPAIVSAQS